MRKSSVCPGVTTGCRFRGAPETLQVLYERMAEGHSYQRPRESRAERRRRARKRSMCVYNIRSNRQVDHDPGRT